MECSVGILIGNIPENSQNNFPLLTLHHRTDRTPHPAPAGLPVTRHPHRHRTTAKAVAPSATRHPARAVPPAYPAAQSFGPPPRDARPPTRHLRPLTHKADRHPTGHHVYRSGPVPAPTARHCPRAYPSPATHQGPTDSPPAGLRAKGPPPAYPPPPATCEAEGHDRPPFSSEEICCPARGPPPTAKTIAPSATRHPALPRRLTEATQK